MRAYLLSTLLLATTVGNAQNLLQRLGNDTMPNLVPNPGFEETQRLQCGWTQNSTKFNQEVMVAWHAPTETTPDHYSTRLDKDCWSHPGKRTAGKALPRSGNAMVGIKVRGKGNTPSYWHEYLQVQLPANLEAGTLYIVEFFILRANFSNEACNNIGLALLDAPVSTRDCLPLYITPVINEDKVVARSMWHKVSGVVRATGKERYVIIGNFYSDEETSFEKQKSGERGAYYFIDDVNIRVAPAGSSPSAAPRTSVPPPPKVRVKDQASTKEVDMYRMEPEVDKRIRLDNIGFEFAKATLTPESSTELDKLAHLLIDYPYMRIEVEGHTDNVGTPEFNQQLSHDRAQAVVEYLRKKKVEAARLTWKGYGLTRPTASNDSEEGRAMNRRVEFRILER